MTWAEKEMWCFCGGLLRQALLRPANNFPCKYRVLSPMRRDELLAQVPRRAPGNDEDRIAVIPEVLINEQGSVGSKNSAV